MGAAFFDFDGDGLSDFGFSAPAKRGSDLLRHFIYTSSDAAVLDLTTGSVGDYPAHADLDGDGKTDLVLVHDDGTNLLWNIRFTATGETRSIKFGRSGDTIISNCSFLGTTPDLAVLTPAGVLRYRALAGPRGRLRIYKGLAKVKRASCLDLDGDGSAELLLQLSNFAAASAAAGSGRARAAASSLRGRAALVAMNMRGEIMFMQPLIRTRAIIDIIGLDASMEGSERPGILERTALGTRLTLFGKTGAEPIIFELATNDRIAEVTTARLQGVSEIENGLFIYSAKNGLEQFNCESSQRRALLFQGDIPAGGTMLNARSSSQTGK